MMYGCIVNGMYFGRLRAALRIELVEIGLPGLEPVMRIAVFAMAVAEQRAVAERLPRQLDHDLAVVLPEERQLIVEAVGVEGEAVLDQQLDACWCSGCRSASLAAPAGACFLIMAMAFFITASSSSRCR